VQPGESLSRIISRVPDITREQRESAMLSVYRANPQAFDGNINLLRAGSILRLPDAAAMLGISQEEAREELRRQTLAWQSGAGVPAVPVPELRLVPPAESSGLRTGAAGQTEGQSDVEARLARLESELAESRRLLNLRDAELARLRAAVEGRQPGAATLPVAGAASAPVPTEPGTAATAEEAAAPAEPLPPPAPAAAAPAPAPQPPSPGALDWVVGHWYYPAGALVLLGGLLGLRAWRRREEDESSVVFEPLHAELPDAPPPPAVDNLAETGGGTLPLRSPNIGTLSGLPPELLKDVQELQDLQQSRETHGDSALAPEVQLPSIGDSGQFAGVGDPLVEADWNISYGLYEQAADHLHRALEREPGRRDLKTKLLEVWFRGDERARFLDVARELADDAAGALPGEWEKIVIMGRQIAPDDPLFAAEDTATSLPSLDLNLEGGQNLVELDVQAEPTRISLADYVDVTDAPPVEPVVTQHVRTIEQQRPDEIGFDLADHTAMLPPVDRTAEISIDDLDLGVALDRMPDLDGTGIAALDDSQVAQMLDATSLDAGFDAGVRRPEFPEGGVELLDSGSWALSTEEMADPSAVTADGGLPPAPPPPRDFAGREAAPADATGVLGTVTGVHLVHAGADPGGTEALDAGDLRQMLKSPANDATHLEPVELPTLEPVTLSEVGTKIDLARAYIDMGDPEGARSILGEVVAEGSTSQRQEAERLMATLPG
jgi:pilus assembly protein FimV